jgi:hypothetical protein
MHRRGRLGSRCAHATSATIATIVPSTRRPIIIPTSPRSSVHDARGTIKHASAIDTHSTRRHHPRAPTMRIHLISPTHYLPRRLAAQNDALLDERHHPPYLKALTPPGHRSPSPTS